MLNISTKYCNHIDWLKEFANTSGSSIINNTILLPNHIGNGYIKVIELDNGLQILISDVEYKDEVNIKLLPAENKMFTLKIWEIKNKKKVTIAIDDKVMVRDDLHLSNVFLTSSILGISFTLMPKTSIKSLNIYLPNEWLQNYFNNNIAENIINEYLLLKTSILNFEVLNFDYRVLMQEIFDNTLEQPLYKVDLQNKVELLLKMFLNNIVNKFLKKSKSDLIDENTIKTLMNIEAVLINNFSVSPPSIAQLARMATMSETKLKTVFKSLYNYGIYEYYQKNRMLKAKQLLSSKKFSVKEVGLSLGFKNLSNFTIAYKKAYNILPSEV